MQIRLDSQIPSTREANTISSAVLIQLAASPSVKPVHDDLPARFPFRLLTDRYSRNSRLVELLLIVTNFSDRLPELFEGDAVWTGLDTRFVHYIPECH